MPLIRKIDDLPFPDFSDFDWSRYPNPRLIPIMSSRGCVLKCSFCYETVYWKKFRVQSAKRIADEIQFQVENHPMKAEVEASPDRFYFMFADSLVNGYLKNLLRMCDELIERELDVEWGGQATIDKRMTSEVLAKLRQAGCLGLCFGLESGSQPVLDKMGKKFQVPEAVQLLRTCTPTRSRRR